MSFERKAMLRDWATVGRTEMTGQVGGMGCAGGGEAAGRPA